MSALATRETTLLIATISKAGVEPTSDRAISITIEPAQVVLAHTLECHGGELFTIAGMSCCAAFASAESAIAGAIGARRAIEAAADATDRPQITMAIHAGPVAAYAGSYFGATLSRAVQLLAAGNPDQILVSQEVYDRCIGQLPRAAELHDLGPHRLKNLTPAEHIYLLNAPELPISRAALRVLDNHQNNLPTHLTPIVGREQERVEVARLLSQPGTRVVTLLGPSGTGKTRLSQQIAADTIECFADGAFFVDLAPISDPTLVASQIAQVLGIVEQADQPLLQTLQERLQKKQLLLMLDNFEQIIAAASQIAVLLAAAPHLKVLVTSHVALQIVGERVYIVPPLELPHPDQAKSFAALLQIPSVALFVERAQAARANSALTLEQLAQIAHLCAELRGLPLAIELAAAYSDLLTPGEISAQLQGLLGSRHAEGPNQAAQMQILQRLLSWSYRLLAPAEQLLFSRLGVFVGGCTIESAEQVCAGAGDYASDILDGVGTLIRRNLLLQEDLGSGDVRYIMLDSIHDYAYDQMVWRGEAAALRERHASYFLDLAERAQSELTGPQQESWLELLEREQSNFRAALSWTIEQAASDVALRIVAALWRFWHVRNHLSEGRRWIEAALALDPARQDHTRAKVLSGAGWIAHVQGDTRQATAFFAENLTIARALGDSREIGMALGGLGRMEHLQGNFARAAELYAEGLAVFRSLADTGEIAWALSRLALLALDQGKLVESRSLFEESLACFEQIQYRWGRAWAMLYLGGTVLAQQNYDYAKGLYQECVSEFRALGDQASAASALLGLGHALSGLGDLAQAETYYRESLSIYQDVGEKRYIPDCLEELARIDAAYGRLKRAAQLYSAAPLLRNVVNMPRPSSRQSYHEQAIQVVRGSLGEQAWRLASAEGQTMEWDQAIACAQE